MDPFVHSSAFVDDGVTIGEDTRIWHFCHIMSGARIGSNNTLGQNVFVGRDVTIGNGCKIQNNVSVYEGVTLEDEIFCGPSMVFTNVDWPRAAFPRSQDTYLKTLVKRGTSIGANATIVCGVVLGRFSFVGAGSVVTEDVPDYALAYGVPAKIHGWVCVCGKKLEFDQETARCPVCNRSYRQLVVAGETRIEESTE